MRCDTLSEKKSHLLWNRGSQRIEISNIYDQMIDSPLWESLQAHTQTQTQPGHNIRVLSFWT